MSQVVHSAALGAMKPDAAFFVAADALIHEGGRSPVLLLDDRLDNVEAARAHGWLAVHVTGEAWPARVDLELAKIAIAQDPSTVRRAVDAAGGYASLVSKVAGEDPDLS